MQNDLTEALASLRIERGAEASAPARRRRPVALAVLSAAALAAAIAIVLPRVAPAERAVHVATTRPLRTGTAPTQAAGLSASGWIVPVQEAVLAPRTAGRVRSFRLQEGDAVRAGEAIVQLDDSEPAAQLARARAALNRAQVALTEQRRLTAVDEGLFAHDALAASALEASRSRLAMAEAEVRLAGADVAVTEAAVEGCRVRAPFDGILTRRLVEVGEVVSVASPPRATSGVPGAVAAVADVSAIEVLVDLNETHLDRVRIGQRAEVELNARPGRRYTARVVRVDPAADRSKGAVGVRVRLVDREEGLRPQLSARVTFLGEPESDGAPPVLSIERGAVSERAGAAVVFALSQGKVQSRPVVLGEAQGARVEVRSGLTGDEVLVMNPPPDLADGARVEAQP